jgi:all-trans-retinol 13,14-reductase
MKELKKYDVVVIGSGLAGLVSAAIMAKEGKRVCVVEKNEQIGGSLQTFKRDGVTFDTGVHYIGGLEKGYNLYQIFNYLGIMERLELVKMDEEGFDVVLFGDDEQEYPYGMGYENFERILGDKFPDQKEAIHKYCEEMMRICNNFPMYYLRSQGTYQDNTVFTQGVKEFIESITDNKKLQNVLAGTNLLYAGIADKTPLYIHALVVNSYIESAMKCKQGGDQIAKLIARVIKENGGDILRKQKAIQLEVIDGVAHHLVLESGEKLTAETFISNIPPLQTLELTDSHVIRQVFRNRIKNLDNSISVFVIYATLKPGTFKHRNRNYYYFDEQDVWRCHDYTEETWPYTYAFFECVPQHQNDFAEAVTIMAYMKYDEVKEWGDTHNTTLHKNERGESYEAFKKRKAEKLFETVEKKFPGFRECVQSYYTSTPLSYRDYIGTTDGNMYGILRDYNDPIKTMISPKTKIQNLYLTGQNINLHGVLGVTVSAVITCSFLIGKDYLVEKILKANEATA